MVSPIQPRPDFDNDAGPRWSWIILDQEVSDNRSLGGGERGEGRRACEASKAFWAIAGERRRNKAIHVTRMSIFWVSVSRFYQRNKAKQYIVDRFFWKFSCIINLQIRQRSSTPLLHNSSVLAQANHYKLLPLTKYIRGVLKYVLSARSTTSNVGLSRSNNRCSSFTVFVISATPIPQILEGSFSALYRSRCLHLVGSFCSIFGDLFTFAPL